MAHAALDAFLVSEACSKTLAKHSLVDANTATRKIVEKLQALAMAADSTPGNANRITVSDDEFILIAAHWEAHKPTVANPSFGQVTQLRSYG
jgi:hypothetical protein